MTIFYKIMIQSETWFDSELVYCENNPKLKEKNLKLKGNLVKGKWAQIFMMMEYQNKVFIAFVFQ